MCRIIAVLSVIAICQLRYVNAFRSLSTTSKYKSNRIKMTIDENVGYDAFGTLTRQGPVPYLIRVFQTETYNAAVDKYMRLENCSRLEAMANMDAYFMDPNGWAGNKLRERKTGKKIDYINVNQSKSSLALTAVWTLLLSALVYRIIDVNL